MPFVQPPQPGLFMFFPTPDGVPFSDAALQAALSYPGVTLSKKNDAILAPLNAAWLVEKALLVNGATFRLWKKPTPTKRWPTELHQIRELRQFDAKTKTPMAEFATGYQLREAFRTLALPGVIFRHPPGSGKTLSSLIWSLAEQGRIVVVTGAKGRHQWRSQIERYTTAKVQTVTGTGEAAAPHEFVVARDLQWQQLRWTMDAWQGARLKHDGLIGCSCSFGSHPVEVVRRLQDQFASHKERLYSVIARVLLTPGEHAVSGIDAPPVTIERPRLDPEARFTVVGWEILPYHIGALCELRPTTTILDESHRGKNHKQRQMIPLSESDLVNEPDAKQLEDGRWVKFVKLENIAACTDTLCKASSRRLLLTATLVKDRIRDAWAQLNYMMPWAFGSYWPWARKYAGAVQNSWGGWDDKGHSNLDELALRLSYHDSYVTAEEAKASLPGVRRDVIYLPPDAQQNEDPALIRELMAASADSGNKTTSVLSVRLAAACSRKRKALCESIIERVTGGAKVCVFTGRHHDVDAMHGTLQSQLPERVKLFRADGRTEVDRRALIVAEYMKVPSHAVMVATGYGLGEQIDLNETDIGIVAMLPLTPADLIQWEGRWLRRGSTRRLLIEYWVAEGTVDERLVGILLDKLPVVEKIRTEGVQGITQAFKGDEEQLMQELARSIIEAGRESDAAAEAEARP